MTIFRECDSPLGGLEAIRKACRSMRSCDIHGGGQGRIQGGPGGQDPPFWGTPKLHKEGKNVARVRAKNAAFWYLTVTRTPPPFLKSCICPWEV